MTFQTVYVGCVALMLQVSNPNRKYHSKFTVLHLSRKYFYWEITKCRIHTYITDTRASLYMLNSNA